MPANKNALIRYKTIDNCLRNKYRRWTLQDLVDACSDALYDMEGITKGVCERTVQHDLQMMRSDKLGYFAPIEVYDGKYYRYSDPDFSITNMPFTQQDIESMQGALDILRQFQDFNQFAELSDILGRLQDKLAISSKDRKPIIHYDNVPSLKGLNWLNPLYNYILHKQSLKIEYQSFNADEPTVFTVFPYMLKEFRNRWFLICSEASGLKLYSFPLDRIKSIESADIPYMENPDFDPEHFFDNVIGVSKNINSTPRRIKFWASPIQSQYIRTKPIHPSQRIVEEFPDGSCIFHIDVVINFEMYSVFMSYGPGVKIISPRNAKKYMEDKLRETVGIYESFVGEKK